MVTITITRDFSRTDVPGYRVSCDCGWIEKGGKVDARLRAQHHIDTKHGRKGMIVE